MHPARHVGHLGRKSCQALPQVKLRIHRSGVGMGAKGWRTALQLLVSDRWSHQHFLRWMLRVCRTPLLIIPGLHPICRQIRLSLSRLSLSFRFQLLKGRQTPMAFGCIQSVVSRPERDEHPAGHGYRISVLVLDPVPSCGSWLPMQPILHRNPASVPLDPFAPLAGVLPSRIFSYPITIPV